MSSSSNSEFFYQYFESLKFTYRDTLESFLPSFESFNKVFRSIVYSKIGTEIANVNYRKFIETLADDIINSEENGLYLALALIQLADNEKQKQLGFWLNDENLPPQRLVDCCNLLFSLLSIKFKPNLLLRENDHPVEILCLVVLSFYNQLDVKKWTVDRQLYINDLNYYSDKPMDRIFVPNFISSNPPKWQHPDDFFYYTPKFIERYDNVKVFEFKKKGSVRLLLMQLTLDEMKKEWITTVFINNNLELFGSKHNLYNHFVSQNIIRTNLVNFEDTLCVTFSSVQDDMPTLDDFENILALESYSSPCYFIIASTLPLYLRMLWRIDPSLEIPLKDGYFYSYIDTYQCPQLLFHALIPIKKEEEEEEYSEKIQVEDINKTMVKFLLARRWIDDSGRYPNKYNVESLYEFFTILQKSANDEAFIEAGAKFIAKIFKIPFKFIKFEKSIEEMEDECYPIFGTKKEIVERYHHLGF